MVNTKVQIYLHDLVRNPLSNSDVQMVLNSNGTFSTSVSNMKNNLSVKQKIAGRVLVARAFNLSLQEVIADKTISLTKYGKPEFVDPRRGFFSISHSQNIVVLIKSDFPVSIDIEKNRLINNINLMENFNLNEQLYIQSAPSKEKLIKRLLKIWTMKEACLKVVGRGLYINPSKVRIVSKNLGLISNIDYGICLMNINLHGYDYVGTLGSFIPINQCKVITQNEIYEVI